MNADLKPEDVQKASPFASMDVFSASAEYSDCDCDCDAGDIDNY
jgi:hypothetical protein